MYKNYLREYAKDEILMSHWDETEAKYKAILDWKKNVWNNVAQQA